MSDLHIGKVVNGFSMIAEQKHVFEQIIAYIKIENPDAVVIAGDIYDRAIAPVEAVRVFDDFLTNLAGENVAVIIISGNHDSPERINYASRLLSEQHIFFYGAFDGSIHKVAMHDEYGEVVFWLLPFIKPADASFIQEGEEIDSYDSYNDVIGAALRAADIDYNVRNVLVSHQFYTKAGFTAVLSDSERNPIGGLDAVDAGIIERFDYVALGHLHGRQSVGEKHICYSGSPVKYSLSEWRQKKSANLVELGEKGDLKIKALPLVPLHDMREIKGEIDKLMSDEISSLADKEDYIYAIFTDEDEVIDPMIKLRSVYPNIMGCRPENLRISIDISDAAMDMEAIENLSDYELFSEFFLYVKGREMSERQIEIVRGLLKGADAE